jgi:prepilin-type N-terminal cleavage/methylation domain-containing protein
MTKKGFTLMELLVSIFISGMVMLALVAMWKTSSNHTAQAQRQSVIRNDNTIFLRRFYSDFVSASEVICPWVYTQGEKKCKQNEYIAVKGAALDPTNNELLVRITEPVCSSGWATEETLETMSSRCIKPSYTVFVYDDENHIVHRCHTNFLDGNEAHQKMDINELINTAHNYCSESGGHRETAMSYIHNFKIETTKANGDRAPELLIEYTINKEFVGDVPPIFFKFRRLLTLKRGV